MIVFDIETGALEEDVVRARIPKFEPPPPPVPFDASSVKVGNLKDPQKIKEKIEGARTAHQSLVESHSETVSKLERQYYSEAMSKAALNPLTGQVLAIGYLTDVATVLDIDEESLLLARFFAEYSCRRARNDKIVGHNIFAFDLPFLVKRAWLLDVEVPELFLQDGRFFDKLTFVDTMLIWSCGTTRDYQSLDSLAQAFGVGSKPDGVDGAMFAKLLSTDRSAAEEYLQNDLRITYAIAEKMGVI